MERNAYRILDVNFNRAREACRMVEEYCRFVLNSSLLTDRTKKIRHKISSLISQIDTGKLLVNRDTSSDVGAARQIKGQISRNDLKDCLTASCKRLTEALRVLTETLASYEKNLSQQFEKLRFQAYGLEKEIVLFADTNVRFSKVEFYVIITNCLHDDIINLTNQCIQGGADCIQLRAKEMPDDKLLATSKEIVRLCKDANVISVINDRIDIAIAAKADGVHLGQNDLPVTEARKLALSPMIIGVSTHNLIQLKEAVTELPTYVALGPVFSTSTKTDAEPVVGLEYIKSAIPLLKDSGLGYVAIGGINPDNVEDVLKAGANIVAVCSSITASKDPAQSCRLFKQKISEFFSRS